MAEDRLTWRAGLALFSRYRRGIGIQPESGRVFGSVSKNGKGLPVADLFQQAHPGPGKQGNAARRYLITLAYVFPTAAYVPKRIDYGFGRG